MVENYFKTALFHHSKGNWNKAKEIYEHILKSNPKNLSVLQNYGTVLSQLREYKLAENIFKKCLKISPSDPLLLYNYGKLFHEQGIFDKAIKYYKDSFKFNPKNDISLYNIGNIFLFQNKFHDAINYFTKVIKTNSSNYMAYNNIAIAYKRIGDLDRALKFYREAIKINKDYVDAHVNYSTILLTKNKLDEGFEEYEWRKKSKSFVDFINYGSLKIQSQIWNGQNLNKKKLLIIAEQGIGDLIQFARYLYYLKKNYKVKIILKIKSKNFLHFFNDDFDIISDQKEIPEHDYHNFMMSLPGVFFKTNNLFIKSFNFFEFNKKIKTFWGNKLKNISGVKVGIHWSTSSLMPERDLPLNYFNKLSKNIDASFIVLQKEVNKEETKILNQNKKIYYFPKMDQNQKAFLDSIEIIRKLDLIITSDTALAHLAATLEKKTWIALPKIADWRWFDNQKNTNWYQNVTLFRQLKIDDWDSVFKNITKKFNSEFKKN